MLWQKDLNSSLNPNYETGGVWVSSKSKLKDTIGFWVQGLCALILVKTVGFFGALVSFVSYFWLEPKIGVFGALACSVILGVAVGLGITALII